MRNVRQIKGLSGWMHDNPLKGMIFLFITIILSEGYAIYKLVGANQILTETVNDCNDHWHTMEEQTNDMLMELIKKQNNINENVDSAQTKVQDIIDKTKTTIQSVKKKI